MIKKDLQKVIREFLSNNRTSLITEVSDETLDLQQKFFNDMLVNKSKIVQRYGKDAEKVMKGKAMNLAKKETEKMEKQRLKELVRKSLMDEAEFSKEYDDNPALKGGQKKLPDALQKSIIAKKGVKEAYGEEAEALALTFKDPNEFERAKQHFESNSDFYPFDINDEFKTFYFQVEDQADADSTEFYLNQELEGETDLQGYYFSTESSPLSEDLDLGHEDNEPHMIKSELYKIGKYAMELYQMVDGFEGKGEVDFPAWWQSKITKACSMIGSAKHYLEFELKEPEIDAMVSVAADEDILDENIDQDEMLAARLYKIKNFVQPAFFKKIRSLINSGDLETAELFISRMEPAAAKNDMEMAKMMGDLEDIDKVSAQRQREKQMANVFTEKKLTEMEISPKLASNPDFKKLVSILKQNPEAAEELEQDLETTLEEVKKYYDYSDNKPKEISAKEYWKRKLTTYGIGAAGSALLGAMMAGGFDAPDVLEMALAAATMGGGLFGALASTSGSKDSDETEDKSSSLEEKKLTKAEKAKKEDIVKGMKKSFKGDESAMYAIATAKAKKVAETITKKLKESNGLKKGDTVEFEGKKYKIGSFDTEANLVYLNTMDNKPAEDSKGSYLKVHATKVKKTN